MVPVLVEWPYLALKNAGKYTILARYITTPSLNNVGVSLAKKVGKKNVGRQLVVSATSINYPCEQPDFQDYGRTRKDLEVLGQL